MSTKNQRWVIAKIPKGTPTPDCWKLEDIEMPTPKKGEVLLKHLYISVDPYLRYRLRTAKPGDVQVSGGIAEVIEVNENENFSKGDKVLIYSGWQRYSVSDGKGLRKINDIEKVAPLSAALGAIGMPGMTAYFGVLDVCKPKEGETFVVSTAAGAVGSIAGQIAKLKGCRVVGITGSDEKVEYITKELGFDYGINYKKFDTMEKMRDELKKACPNGIDCYFDNVGGYITDAVFHLINLHSRIAICGQISQYNKEEPEMGPRLLPFTIWTRALIKGFIVGDYDDRRDEFIKDMSQWVKENKIKFRETIRKGFENLPEIFLQLFKGENIGKLLCQVE